jgi:hypothetical protein
VKQLAVWRLIKNRFALSVSLGVTASARLGEVGENCSQRSVEASKTSAMNLGKIWERTPNSKNRLKSHRINGPYILIRAHNPKVVSSNLTVLFSASS